MIPAFHRSRHDREIFRLAVPALGALAADPLVSLVDTAFVGRLGAESLAAVAVASALFAVAFAVFNFLEYAVTPLVANAIGAGRRREAGEAAGAAFVMAGVSGVVAAIVLLVFGETLLGVFGSRPAVLDLAHTYLAIRLFALPAVLTVMVGHGVFRGYQDTRTPLLVTIGLNVVNLVLDPILIFGLGWGVAGAATATVIAQWAGALWFLALVAGFRREAMGVRLGGIGGEVFKPLLSAGGRLIFRNASLLAAITVSTAVASRVGTAAVAAHQIAIQLWVFLALVLDALAIAGQAMVGKAIGAGTGGAREISNRLLALSLLLGLLLAAVLAVAAPWLGGWFTSDAAVIGALGSIYAFVIVAQPLNALVFVWDGVAIGAGAFALLAWSTFAASVTALLVMAAGRGLGLGLPAVWIGMTALMLVRAGALLRWYERGPLAAERGPSPASRGA
jgi:MATE family multidrug resistance protein